MNSLGDTVKEVNQTRTSVYTLDAATGHMLTSTFTDSACPGEITVKTYDVTSEGESSVK